MLKVPAKDAKQHLQYSTAGTHSQSALVSLLHVCAGRETTRLLNAVLSCLEDLEFILVRMQPAIPALPVREMHSREPVDLTSCS